MPLSIVCVCKRGRANVFSHYSGASRRGRASNSRASAHHPSPTPLATHTRQPQTPPRPTFYGSACGIREGVPSYPPQAPVGSSRLFGVHLVRFCAITSSGPVPSPVRVRRNREDTDRQGAAAGKEANLRFTFGPNSCSPLLKIPGLGPQNFRKPEALSFHSTSQVMRSEVHR